MHPDNRKILFCSLLLTTCISLLTHSFLPFSFAFREAHNTQGCEVIKHSTHRRLQGQSGWLWICKNRSYWARTVTDWDWRERNCWLCRSRVSEDKPSYNQERCVLLWYFAPRNSFRPSSYWGQEGCNRKDYSEMGMYSLPYSCTHTNFTFDVSAEVFISDSFVIDEFGM